MGVGTLAPFLLPMACASLLHSRRDSPHCTLDSYSWRPLLATGGLESPLSRLSLAQLFQMIANDPPRVIQQIAQRI
jgi:hypothetical protein